MLVSSNNMKTVINNVWYLRLPKSQQGVKYLLHPLCTIPTPNVYSKIRLDLADALTQLIHWIWMGRYFTPGWLLQKFLVQTRNMSSRLKVYFPRDTHIGKTVAMKYGTFLWHAVAIMEYLCNSTLWSSSVATPAWCPYCRYTL